MRFKIFLDLPISEASKKYLKISWKTKNFEIEDSHRIPSRFFLLIFYSFVSQKFLPRISDFSDVADFHLRDFESSGIRDGQRDWDPGT